MDRLRFLFITVSFLIVSSCAAFAGQKNVILIIPDGCSVGMWASIRAIISGGKLPLSVDELPVQGRCSTYSANALITDSSASATAYSCGIKTTNGVLGVDARTVKGDSLSGGKVESILEKAEKAGYATGLVTTAMIQHATPAAFYSHRADRDWYDLIALDLLGKNIDVLMGGGRENMIPSETKDNEGGISKRKDNRNIIEEMKKEGYVYIDGRAGFNNLDDTKLSKVLCIFNPGHMEYEFDRKTKGLDEPPLWEMADKAINILSNSKKGFFLMIEAGRIDHAAHVHDTIRYLWDGIACEKTVAVAKAFAEKNKDTLLIVVPDHGNGNPSLAGLYKVTEKDTTLAQGEESGFPIYRLDPDGFPSWDGGMPIALQWPATFGHTGEDVALSAMGPSSSKLDGYITNIKVNEVMTGYFDFKGKKTKTLEDIVDY